MAENKMTQKEMYAYIMEEMADDEMVVEFCQHKIDQLNKPKISKRTQAAIDFAEEVYQEAAALGEEFTSSEMAERFEVNVQKMNAALRRLVKEDRLERFEGKGKTRTTFLVK